MNIGGVHELYWLIKNKYLTEEEKTSLDDFQFQNYLIELSQLKPRHYDLGYLIKEILFFLRIDAKFWAPFTSIHRRLVKTEELRAAGLNPESVQVSFDVVDEIVKRALQKVGQYTERDPIILYNQEIQKMQNLKILKSGQENFPKKRPNPNKVLGRVLSEHKNKIFDGLIDSVLHAPFRAKAKLVERVCKRIKKPKNRGSLSGFERRKLRRGRNQAREEKSVDEEALHDLAKNPLELERRLGLDTRHIRKVDFSLHLHFNPHMHSVMTVNFRFAQLLFQHFSPSLIETSPSQRSLQVSLFRLQTFIFFLLVDQFELGTNDLRKKFDAVQVVQEEFEVSWSNRRWVTRRIKGFWTFAGSWSRRRRRRRCFSL